ncbi:endonuclease III [uncultured Methylovirgula sp.]|uniref:endonuclease III n=1 Tax=uncultured Methylovirgula sp. TaxID=1285960 RepID=UPI002611BBE3|nr:endonuclease III [uncultured Methylovirgula sp.]
MAPVTRAKPKPAAKVPAIVPSKAPADPAGKRRAGRWPKPVPPETVAEIFRRFAEANPHPRGELHSKNAFTLLIAVVLSAQATDAGVNKATPALFAVADTPEKMLALGEDKVRDLIKTIGLYRAKAKNIIGLSRALVENFGGAVPDTREALETLPGVGRKTANVVLNNAFAEPVIAVDTHVFRVSNRIPLVAGKTVREVEDGLERIVPHAYKLHAHHWLILHGRYICQARKPQCWRCLIEDLCRWPKKTPAPAA